MNAVLAGLLTACGVSGLQEPDAWERVVLMHNQGGVPGDEAVGDVVWNRGFNLLIIDRAGRPTHFCKCRAADPALRAGESLATRLSEEPALSRIVPRSWTRHSPEMDLVVSAYLSGELLDRRLRHMSRPALREALADILAAASTVAAHAARLDPSLLAGAATIDLAETAAWTFPILREAGIAEQRLAALERALADAGSVPRALQHGDLWPRNIVSGDDGWWLLDFEMYGRVQVPLYDAAHLARTCWERREMRRDRAGSWLAALRSRRGANADYAEMLDAAREEAGLDQRQGSGALVHYVVDVAARLLSRHVAADDARPYVREVEWLGERLAIGESVAELTPVSG